MERKAFLVATPALVVALFAALALASQASAFIYWADTQNQTIGRANNDGSGVNDAFIHTGELPFAVAVDSSHVYWANQNGNSIGRANIDGSEVNNSFITGITKPSGLAVNATSIFWSTLGGQIGKASISGTGVNPNLVTGPVEPCGLALDSGHVYWGDIATGTPAYIGRAGLDGSSKQLTYVTIPGTAYPCGVAVNSANIFWTEPGIFGGGTRIGRANTNTGTGADPSFIGDAKEPCGIAVFGSQLYWANAETDTIARANSDGTAVDQSFITTGANQNCGVAVDNLASPLSPPPAGGGSGGSAGGGGTSGGLADTTPPMTTILKGPGKKLAQGKAKFAFSSSEPASHFQCKLDKAKPKPCTSPKTYKGQKPGRHTFKVWAIDAAGNKATTPAKRSFKVPAS
jgi:streptogramin lyase